MYTFLVCICIFTGLTLFGLHVFTHWKFRGALHDKIFSKIKRSKTNIIVMCEYNWLQQVTVSKAFFLISDLSLQSYFNNVLWFAR